jgi:hypothetical protein
MKLEWKLYDQGGILVSSGMVIGWEKFTVPILSLFQRSLSPSPSDDLSLGRGQLILDGLVNLSKKADRILDENAVTFNPLCEIRQRVDELVEKVGTVGKKVDECSYASSPVMSAVVGIKTKLDSLCGKLEASGLLQKKRKQS